MKFSINYAIEAEKADRTMSEEELLRASGAMLRYCMMNFDDDKMSRFLLSMGYFNELAKTGGDLFEYELDEVKKTGGFRLVTQSISVGKSGLAGKGLLHALKIFSELKIKAEDGRIVICGVADLS